MSGKEPKKKPKKVSSRPADKGQGECNERVIEETILETGESKGVIEHAMKFLFAFVGHKMMEGSYESIRLQGWGTFKPKLKRIQYREMTASLPPVYKKLLNQRTVKPPPREATDDQPGHSGDRPE